MYAFNGQDLYLCMNIHHGYAFEHPSLRILKGRSNPSRMSKNIQHYNYIYIYIFEGSLEVKLPTIWTDEKQSREEAERRERLEERRVEEKE